MPLWQTRRGPLHSAPDSPLETQNGAFCQDVNFSTVEVVIPTIRPKALFDLWGPPQSLDGPRIGRLSKKKTSSTPRTKKIWKFILHQSQNIKNVNQQNRICGTG